MTGFISARAGLFLLVTTLFAPGAPAAQQSSCCGGQMTGGGGMADQQNDMQLFHQLLNNREKIQREVKMLPNGVDTTTTTADASVAGMLRTHVTAMARRLEEGRPIHARDPLFAEIFKHAQKITVAITPLAAGVRVVETSADPFVVKLIQQHAGVINLFLENGMSEMHRDHPVPPQ